MKFEPIVKSENHELFLINDNSKIETEKIKLISDFSLQNPELPDEKLSAIKVLWSNVELSSGVYNEEYLSNLREYLKFLEENSKLVFIYPVAQKNFENPEEAENFISAMVHAARRIKDAQSVVGFALPDEILIKDKSEGFSPKGYAFWFVQEMSKKHSHYVYFADETFLKENSLFDSALKTDFVFWKSFI